MNYTTAAATSCSSDPNGRQTLHNTTRNYSQLKNVPC